jgi:hypothetical protein
MEAYRLKVAIPDDRVLRLPNEVPTGPAEIIVLSDRKAMHPTDVEALLRIGEEWRAKHRNQLRSKEEIDRYIEEERASWNDDDA